MEPAFRIALEPRPAVVEVEVPVARAVARASRLSRALLLRPYAARGAL